MHECRKCGQFHPVDIPCLSIGTKRGGVAASAVNTLFGGNNFMKVWIDKQGGTHQ